MILLLAPAAAAPIDCVVTPYVGTVGYLTSLEARRSHAKAYSATGMIERDLLPTLDRLVDDDHPTGSILRLSLDSLEQAVTLPGAGSADCATGPNSLGWYDVHAFTFGTAFRYRWFTAYYASTANAGLVADHWVESFGGQMFTYLLGYPYAAIAPFVGATGIRGDELNGIDFDWVAGADVDAEYVQGGAGYVGSRGAWFDLRQPQSRAFLNGIAELEDTRDLLRYLRTGLLGTRWFLREGPQGGTDLFYRSLAVTVPQAGTAAALLATDRDRPHYDFTSGTLAQRDVFGVLDLSGTYAVRPAPSVYDLELGLHTRGFHPDLMTEVMQDADELFLGRVVIGTVDLPALPWYAVEGGRQPWAALEVGYWKNNGSGAATIRALGSVKLNDPDTLAMFPFAQGAWQIHASADVMFR